MEENCVKQTEYNLYYYEILIEGVTIQFTWINRQKAIKKTATMSRKHKF